MTAVERTQAGHEPDDDLASSVRALGDRIEALQADVRRLGGPALPSAEVGWEDEERLAGPPSYAWMGALEPRVRRRPAVPRLLLEALFLAAVALATGLAALDAPVIVAVMAGAWLLVALIEWAASRADRQGDIVIVAAAPEPEPADPAWFVPPVEQTLLENAISTDSVTAVTKLPPPQAELDATAERPPAP